MINKKLAGLLMVPIIGATIGMASAAPSPTASQTLTVTLGSLVNITADGGNLNASVADLETGNLSAALTPKFKIQTNSAQTLYVKATTASTTNPTEVAFFQQSGQVYAILSNITNKPLAAALTDCKAATPVADNNANAIAYNVTGVVLTGATTSTPTFDNTKNQYTISANAGQTSATTTIATTALANTYSYLDTAGTYQAVVTLSNVSL